MFKTKLIEYLLFGVKIFIICVFIYYLLIGYIFLILNFFIILFIVYLEILKKIKKHFIYIFNVKNYKINMFGNFFYLLIYKNIIYLIKIYIDKLYYNKNYQLSFKKIIFFFFFGCFIFLTKFKIMIAIIMYNAGNVKFQSENYYSSFIIIYFEMFSSSYPYELSNGIILVNYDKIMYTKY